MKFSSHGPILVLVLSILAGSAVPTMLPAQMRGPGVSQGARQHRLESLAHERSLRWLQTAPVVHCGPAPLTERPTASAEFGRGSVAPLESAFLDAVTVQRMV